MGISEFENSLRREESLLSSVVALVREIAAQTRELHLFLCKRSADPKMAELWRKAAERDKSRLEFWERVSALTERSGVSRALEDERAMLEELRATRARMARLLAAKEELLSSNGAAMLGALKAEFCGLHHATLPLIKLSKPFLSSECPYESYERSLDELAGEYFEINGEAKPETMLLVDALKGLWKDNKKLAETSSVDELTGALDRRGFSHAAVPMVGLAQRKQDKIAFMIADIDRFKSINDLLGHPAGDKVIKTVATALRYALRGSDILGRYGGEEFSVLCSPIRGEGTDAIAERLRTVVESCYFDCCRVTISIGAVEATPPMGMNAGELVALLCAHADSLLLQAKQTGRNKAVFQEHRFMIA